MKANPELLAGVTVPPAVGDAAPDGSFELEPAATTAVTAGSVTDDPGLVGPLPVDPLPVEPPPAASGGLVA